MKKNYLILLFIIVVAAFLRFYQLGTNPPSLTWDEASWGYNAYSLGVDGRDEFGRFLPIDYLESFGDFKPPAYAYLDIIPIKFLGLNPFAVRFPSAFLGVLTVLLTYFLVGRIFWQSKSKDLYALLSSLFLAISPWHVMLSRAAFEANVTTFLTVLGIWFFLIGIQNKKWFLLLSAVSFALSIYTFNTARIVAPLLVLSLAVGFRKELFMRKKQVILAIILGILLLLPTARFLLSAKASLRFREVNIFSDIGVIENTNQEIANDSNAFWSKIIHNRRFTYASLYLRHYFDNLSSSFLFIKGDGNPKFSTQAVGQMYLWDLPFFIAGVFILFRKKEGYWWVIPLWLILGIIPAGTARETPHALRTEITLPTFQIITAMGVATFLFWIKNMDLKQYFRFSISAFIFIILLINFLYFYHDYNAHYAREFSREWQYGYEDSIRYVSKAYGNYNLIEVTSELGRPYIYYLFFTKTNPNNFRKTAKIHHDAFGFVNVLGYDKFRFMNNLDNKKGRILYINSSHNIPKKARVLKTFYLLNGESILTAYIM